MKYSIKNLIYWTSPLLIAVLLIGIVSLLFFLSDERFLENYPGPSVPNNIAYLLLFIILGVFVIIGYVTCILYSMLRYHSGVLIGTILLFLGMGFFFRIKPSLSQGFPEEYSIFTFILNFLQLTLIWLSYPLPLCILLYTTRKRKNKDETDSDSDSEENPISPQTEEMEKIGSIYNRTTVDINNEK